LIFNKSTIGFGVSNEHSQMSRTSGDQSTIIIEKRDERDEIIEVSPVKSIVYTRHSNLTSGSTSNNSNEATSLMHPQSQPQQQQTATTNAQAQPSTTPEAMEITAQPNLMDESKRNDSVMNRKVSTISSEMPTITSLQQSLQPQRNIQNLDLTMKPATNAASTIQIKQSQTKQASANKSNQNELQRNHQPATINSSSSSKQKSQPKTSMQTATLANQPAVVPSHTESTIKPIQKAAAAAASAKVNVTSLVSSQATTTITASNLVDKHLSQPQTQTQAISQQVHQSTTPHHHHHHHHSRQHSSLLSPLRLEKNHELKIVSFHTFVLLDFWS
jgi:hypothetical protein